MAAEMWKLYSTIIKANNYSKVLGERERERERKEGKLQ
jgi:hypothetical protein